MFVLTGSMLAGSLLAATAHAPQPPAVPTDVTTPAPPRVMSVSVERLTERLDSIAVQLGSAVDGRMGLSTPGWD